VTASRESLLSVIVLLSLAFPVAAEIEPGPENDYGRTRQGGLSIEWEPLLHGTGLDGWRESGSPWTPGGWSREGESVLGRISGQRVSRITQGDTSWVNYELSVHATLEKGSNLQLHVRVSEDGMAFYMVEFDYSWQSLNISKRDRDTGRIVKLSVVNFVLEEGREYHLVISARQQSLTTYIDGMLVNQLTDDSYSRGGVGLNMWWTTTASFRDPKIRHYRWP
jgi:hypothetical protein